jgi:hypothetical protein
MNFTRHIAALGLFSAAALAIAPNAQAASFGTSGISFDKDTTLEFTFQVSHGKFESELGAFDISSAISSILLEEVDRADEGFKSDDLGWKGTCGDAVAVCTAKYTFEANKSYSLRLLSELNGSFKSLMSSTSTDNNGSKQRAIFASQSVFETNIFTLEDGQGFGNAASYTDGLALLKGAGVWIGFDDGGNGDDMDYQDFVVSAKIVEEDVPEPASIMGLMVVGAAALKLRRRNDA